MTSTPTASRKLSVIAVATELCTAGSAIRQAAAPSSATRSDSNSGSTSFSGEMRSTRSAGSDDCKPEASRALNSAPITPTPIAPPVSWKNCEKPETRPR